MLVFCCPEARQPALYAVSQGLNLFLGGPTENGASAPKTAQKLRRRRNSSEDGVTAPRPSPNRRGVAPGGPRV
jgi:hypothetical protein